MNNYPMVAVIGDRVRLTIGVQSFDLAYDPDDEEGWSRQQALEWMAGQLHDALNHTRINTEADEAVWNMLSDDDRQALSTPAQPSLIAAVYGSDEAAFAASKPSYDELVEALARMVKMTEDGDITTVELDEARALLARCESKP